MVVWQGEVRGATATDPSQYDIFARIYTADGSGGGVRVGTKDANGDGIGELLFGAGQAQART